MRALAVSALAIGMAMSGCSEKRCCIEGRDVASRKGKESDMMAPEGGAAWSGTAGGEEATVQFSAGTKFNPPRQTARAKFHFKVPALANAEVAAVQMSQEFNKQTSRIGNDLACAAKPRGESVEFFCADGVDLELEEIEITGGSQPRPGPGPFNRDGHEVSGTLKISKTP